MAYKRIGVVKPSDLTITNDRNAEFESSVTKNIVTLTLTEVQDPQTFKNALDDRTIADDDRDL